MIKKRLIYGLTYSAIEHNTDIDNKEAFTLLSLFKKDKELIIKNRNRYSDLEKLFSFLKQQHVFLIVNNHQVLSKETDVINNSPELIVKNAFPSIALSDFYYEVYTTETSSFVSISRKEFIDNLISKYEKNQVSIIGFSLGTLVIQNVLSFINYDEVCTSSSILKIKNHQLERIEKTVEYKDVNYSVNDLEVTNKELLPLGGILSYYLEKNNQLGLHKKNKELKDDYFQKQLFFIVLKTGLAFLFLVLLLNFLVFNHYYSENNKLITEVQLNENYKSQLLKLQNQIDQKEKVIDNLSSVSQSKVSLYLDEIALLIPKSITLIGLEYQPLTTRIKKDKQITISKNRLQVKGGISNNEDFTSFINSLEQKEWIDEVIIELGKEKKKTSFKVLIYIIHE